MADGEERSEGDGGLIADIRRRILRRPEIADWKDLKWLVERPTRGGRATWDLSNDACVAVGGEPQAAWPAAASVFCLLYSIHLVDDLLDDDPDGMYHTIGIAGAANAALALQSVATMVLEDLGLAPEAEVAAHRRLGEICLGTAYGQMLDSLDLGGEEAYWRVVDLKTPPLFAYALFVGAVTGSGDIELATRVAGLGHTLGRMIQMSDDLNDAMEKPASPDWTRESTNLAILYASTADHPEKEAFERLKTRVTEDEEALAEAQEILVRSGAFSYCNYQLIHTYREARSQIDAMDLAVPQALITVFDHYVRPLKKLLESVGVEAPEELFEAGDG